jgi:nucleoside-diphosphate-sugar epimerase
MKTFVAGATGAIGRALVPRLVRAGHEVFGTTRSEAKRMDLYDLGAEPIVLDALNAQQVEMAVAEVRPDVIVHELTSITTIDMRHFDRSFAPTNRLRTQGTDHLLSAGRAAGVKRFIAQSYTSWPYARVGGAIKTEDDPLDPYPPKTMREGLDALRHLEEAVLAADWTTGIVLRYGGLYGPATSLAEGGEQFEMIRKRRYPIVGNGAGVWSFVHVEDAADATVAAIEHGERGIYNIVDDEPAPVSEWLPVLARRLGAKPPIHVPRVVGRLAAGEAAVVMMTEIRGASNAKAKRELGWKPAHPSWRLGFGT